MSKRLDRFLLGMILIGTSVMLLETAYLRWYGGGTEPASPTRVQMAHAGKVIPMEVVPQHAEVVAILMNACVGCDESVAVWNELVARGVDVVAVTGALPLDARLFVKRTGAKFPVIATESVELLEEFVTRDRVPVTLVVNGRRVVEFSISGPLSSAGLISERLGK